MSFVNISAVQKFMQKATTKRIRQRYSLIALSFILAFTITMPNQVMALGTFSFTPQAKQPTSLQAKKVDTTKPQTVADTPTGGTLESGRKKDGRTRDHEDTSKRTAFTSTYVNKDGTKTLEYSPTQQNFKQGSVWQKINNNLTALDKAAPAKSFLDIITNNTPKADPPSQYNGKAGVVSASMKPLSEGLQIAAAGKTLTIRPLGARNAMPERKDDRTVIYKNAWPNVDLEYELRGETVKEIIVVKDKSAQATYDFKVDGGKVIDHPTRKGELTIEGMPEEFSFSSLTLDVNEQGVISEQRVTQTPSDKGIHVAMDKGWMRSQPTKAFPMKIDPSFGRDATSYWMFKSDGYSCGSGNCYANIGTIDNGGWKHWRTYFHFPFNDMAGKKILDANLHGYYKTGQNGIGDGRTIWMGHANCISFHCTGSYAGAAGGIGGDFDINFTGSLQASVNNSDWGTAWSLWGEEGPYKSFKPYYNLRAFVTYDTPTPQATPIDPADKQVTISTQPTLRVNPVGDADGDAVKYYYRVSTSPDAETGAVINSGWVTATQWTIPDGILQDGTTYYWHVYTMGATQTNPTWVRSFKVDLRTGKDSTQAYDTVGPIGIDLATGNGTTSTDSHSMSALGGSIGLSLNYNTPARTKSGLIGQYWNVSSSNTNPSGNPQLVQNDQDVNFNWPNGSSPGGGINNDWFVAKWKGYFVAPNKGNYKFGASNDDAISISVGGQSFGGCYGSTPCYNNNSIDLEAGQAVPIEVQLTEATGDAYVRLYVKGAVAEQIVPRDWLKTEVQASQAQYGLTGRYYTDNGSHVFPTDNSDPMRLMMVRNDSKLSFNWGSGGPASGLQADNFMTRWTGYITVPHTGSYKFGATADDGVRVKLNNGFLGAQQTVLDSWQYTPNTVWGNPQNLTAGQQIPITVEYFEVSGGASMALSVKGPDGVEQEIPVKWLTPKASALPNSWQLGLDVDGDVAYERLRMVGSNVVLEDSTRMTHEYTWTGSGYKPPVNEDGVLTRNANNTFTLIDTDGRTYIFNAEGSLISLTTPTDDRKPANIKYEYAGDPSRLMKIIDGVNVARSGTLHYRSVNEDGNCTIPSGFDAAPDGMLCAFKTSDGDITRFYYKNEQLSRVEKPGSERIDYGYDSLGRLIQTRDSVANDAISANIRQENDELLTQVNYDALGRASVIQAPAPTPGTARVNHTFEYLPSATQMHISGTAEPNGFSKRIDYDSLLRTTKETDVANLTSHTEWDSVKDLELSKTDATGLKSTTIYDDDDRPIENYGPAPSGRYGVDRKPLAAHVSQIPKTSTGYDEGMTGLSVSYTKTTAPQIENTLGNGQTMYKEDRKWSLDRRFQFVYQSDGNIVLYGPNGVEWASHTSGIASNRLVMQGDGNLVLYDGNTPRWSSGGSAGTNSANLRVQNDGNVVVYRSNGSTWATNTGGWPSAGASNVSFTGAPLLNATNIATDGTISKDFGASHPVSGQSGAWGTSMTGKMRLPSTGNWSFRINSDGGVRVWIDDVIVQDDWTNDIARFHPTIIYNNTSVNSVHRIKIDSYHNTNTPANFALYATPPGGSETANVAQYFNPAYGLKTSETAYDAQLGNVTTTTTYNKPEYGLVDKTTLDPTGLNLQTTSTYETPGSGYLRQTSKTLPGGGVTTYQHYGANDERDNPCTTEVEAFRQAGRPKGKIEADPDGNGPQESRTSETIYNESGEVVATKFNDDNWTCTEYDNRGRVLRTIVPALESKPSRTIVNDYAKDGNPLITTTADTSGVIRVENDLLGRTLKYIDAKSKVAENTYDTYGKLTSRTSPLGTETYEYDLYDRLTKQKLDNVTFATITYDQYSRLATVQYPAGISLSNISRDTLGRENGTTFSVNGQQYTDSIERYVSGDIKQGTENGATKSYQYDNAGRLTNANIAGNTFSYEFGTPDTSCSSVAGYNANTAKNGNRTKFTMNGVSTTYCYDMADRLISSSDQTLTNAQYDSRGNTTSLGDSTHRTEFGYDASDRNTKIKSGTKETIYSRDAQDRIIGREHKESGTTVGSVSYGFTGSGDSPDYLLDATGTVKQKYLTLPGDVVVTIKTDSQSAGATTYSIPNIHGDIYATVNADGALISTHQTGPFGEALPSQQNPVNTASDTSWNYVGQHQKLTDTDSSEISGGIIQMGARLYVPALGRFLSVDPIEGGTNNSYVYANDPVNQYDLDGKWIQVPLMIARIVVIAKSAQKVWKSTASYRGKVGAALYNSEHFGRKSAYFGSKGLGAQASGKWNNNDFIRIGWGKAPQGQKAFRVVIGPERWKKRPHLDIFKGRYK